MASKIQDRQLDATDLTLREIAAVEDQFVKILGGVVHRRIEYPETRHLTDANGDSEGVEETEVAALGETTEVDA